MKQTIKELEKLEATFRCFREQASVGEEHFRGTDSRKESEMKGCKLAYGQAAGFVHQIIKTLEKKKIASNIALAI